MTHNVTPDQEKELTAKQREAALLLASGTTAVLTAEKLSVSRTTVERWKAQPLFREAIHEAENELYKEALSLLKRSMKDAINCLIRNMNCKANYVQVQSASKLLDQALELGVNQETEARLRQLEDLLAHSDIQPRGSDE